MSLLAPVVYSHQCLLSANTVYKTYVYTLLAVSAGGGYMHHPHLHHLGRIKLVYTALQLRDSSTVEPVLIVIIELRMCVEYAKKLERNHALRIYAYTSIK